MDKIENLWKTMRHNIKLLKIRMDVTKPDVLNNDYTNIMSFIDNEGEKSIQESISYYKEHQELNEKISECMTRYENNFKNYNSDPMDVSKALALIDFVKCFPKYIDFDLHTDLSKDEK